MSFLTSATKARWRATEEEHRRSESERHTRLERAKYIGQLERGKLLCRGAKALGAGLEDILFKLPPELRNNIYEEIHGPNPKVWFDQNGDIRFNEYTHHPFHANKVLYEEYVDSILHCSNLVLCLHYWAGEGHFGPFESDEIDDRKARFKSTSPTNGFAIRNSEFTGIRPEILSRIRSCDVYFQNGNSSGDQSGVRTSWTNEPYREMVDILVKSFRKAAMLGNLRVHIQLSHFYSEPSWDDTITVETVEVFCKPMWTLPGISEIVVAKPSNRRPRVRDLDNPHVPIVVRMNSKAVEEGWLTTVGEDLESLGKPSYADPVAELRYNSLPEGDQFRRPHASHMMKKYGLRWFHEGGLLR